MKRRAYLAGLAGLGAVSAVSGVQPADARTEHLAVSAAVGSDSHHPGPPRIVSVGTKLVDPIHVDAGHGMDRDNLAPRIAGSVQRDPDTYSAADFTWSIASKPTDSSARLRYAAEPWEGDEAGDPYEVDSDADGRPRWAAGRRNVAEFIPDVPGTYVLELAAPDGTHELTIRAFPEPADGAGGPPRIELEGRYDAATQAFVVESNPALAPDSTASMNDLVVEFLADDRDALSTADVTVEGTTARIPKSALDGERARIHAAAFDGTAHSVTDTVTLDPTTEGIEYPNRPPQWIKDGVMYEIFTRSFEGTPGGTDFAFMREKVDYLDQLGVDVVWLTPIVPSESANWKPANGFEYVGGGPHGYDALSYFDVAPDLGSKGTRENAMAEYRAFIEACHERDIKVCFDFVINHGGRHHPYFRDTVDATADTEPPEKTYDRITSWNRDSKYFEWFDRMDAPKTYTDGSALDVAPAATGFWGLRVMPQWNYSNLAVREHILAAAAFWAEMGVDAFRCDIAWGVPHSFWKEVRTLVKSYDAEFMLLDEAIPNDPSFSECEFDMHFDTADFMTTAHAAAKADVDGQALFDAVKTRKREGFPDFTVLANAIENHDERRCLNLANRGSRSDPAKAQRAAWAAGVTLPGVPFIYYGQERQITNYGENRHQGSADPRDGSGDIGPEKCKRAFMNWENYPEAHLQFYRDVVSLYHDTDALKNDADLTTVWYQSDDDVLVFGRDASHLDAVAGPERVIVVINFQDGPARVDLRPSVATTDRFTGEDVSVATDGEATTVEVDELAVLETPGLFSLGDRITRLVESTGDDAGPGSYTYPTGDAYPVGAFDVSELTVYETDDTYQFAVALDGPVENPMDRPKGISIQHLQLYLHDPGAEDGARTARTGVDAAFTAPYQYRVVADGQHGARVESHDGRHLATGTVMANPMDDVIVVEAPKAAFDTGLKSMAVAPLLLGYDPDAPGNVMQVAAEADRSHFGGASGDGTDPNVIDLVTPQGVTNAQALSHGADRQARIPYTPVETPYETAAVFEDDVGDNHGPGGYTHPTGGDFHDGLWDLQHLTVAESRSRVAFALQLATDVQNPWNLPNGFSHEFVQLYLRDETAEESVPSTTQGRTGLNATFAEAYQYRVVVAGETLTRVEDASGDVVTSDVAVSVEGDTITIDLPKDAVGDDLDSLALAALVCPYDGYGTGSLREIAASTGEYTIGGGSDEDIEPRVMDLLTPEGTTQAEALAYTASETATIPLIPLESGTDRGEINAWRDEIGDDHGPGTYTYPTSEDISDGVFDLTDVSIRDRIDEYEFIVGTSGPITNVWDADAGFSVHHLQVYVRDPDADGSLPATTAGRTGTNVTFQRPYHYRITVRGWADDRRVETAAGETVTKGFPASADPDAGTISFRIPKSAVGGGLEDDEIAVLLFGHDGYGPGGIRQVAADNGTWTFGGGTDGEIDPNVIDMLVPDGTSQAEALAYGDGSKASLPYLPVVPSVVDVFSDDDGEVTAEQFQRAREHWASGTPVPELGGRTLSYADVRTLRTVSGL